MCGYCAHTCTCALWAHLCTEYLGTLLPKACCARRHPAANAASCITQSMWKNWAKEVLVRASRAASSTWGEHPRGLTWLSRTFHRTPLLPWPLPLTLLVMLQSSDGWPGRNVQFCCPALRINPRANSYDAHRPRRPQEPFGKFWKGGGMQGCGQGCHQVWPPP